MRHSYRQTIVGPYIITPPQLQLTDAWLHQIELILKTGVKLIQYRDKTASLAAQLQFGKSLRALCHSYNAKLIINDHLTLAVELQADGLHLGQHDISLSKARAQMGSNAIIGISCHNQVPLVAQAVEQGADYVALGRFFPSKTKPFAPQASPSLIHTIKQQFAIPIVAIGGITFQNGGGLIQQGADALAVIDSVFSQRNLTKACQQLLSLFHLPS